jgi:hypothetical protein
VTAKQQENILSSMEGGMRIMPAVYRVEFVSDKMYIILRGGWW